MMKLKSLACPALLSIATTVAVVGCDSSNGNPGIRASGGSMTTGGSKGSGGDALTGGSMNTGGTSSNGGSPATGGNSATGGTVATGGTLSAGGGTATGGKPSTGGNTITGGQASAGTGSGGITGTGGQSVTGGQSGNGGRSGSGGTGGSTGGADAGSVDAGPEAPGGTIGDYGNVYFVSSTRTQIVRLQTTLLVPAKPPASGTLFLWPGLEPLPGSANFNPIGTGVLQPVLTWGSSCAPGTQPSPYSSWWISAQYVNTLGNATGYKGCYGGSVMSVKVGDELTIDIQLVAGKWNQTVTDVQTNKSVTFTEDLGGQGQNWAMFVIEEYSSAPVSLVIFNNTVITYGAADAADCKLDTRGPTDFVSVPVASSDGLKCSVAQIILRAKGIQ